MGSDALLLEVERQHDGSLQLNGEPKPPEDVAWRRCGICSFTSGRNRRLNAKLDEVNNSLSNTLEASEQGPRNEIPQAANRVVGYVGVVAVLLCVLLAVELLAN